MYEPTRTKLFAGADERALDQTVKAEGDHWRNDGTGYSHDVIDSRVARCASNDEPIEDLRERWEMHWLGDGIIERESGGIDATAIASEPVGEPEIPRKPCGIERGHREEHSELRGKAI